jgi:hypothetical protein
MTREQYEQRKRRLDEQLHAGIQLLESAHQAQVRALDLVWMLQAEEGGAGLSGERLAGEAVRDAPPAVQEAPQAPGRPRRRMAGELEGEIHGILPQLPETFTRADACAALGYEPDRGSLYRALQDLVRGGFVRVESFGSGRIPTIYRKTGASDASTGA